MIQLGYAPQELEVVLAAGSAFSAGMRNLLGVWDAGVVVSLTFTHEDTAVATWTATVDGDLVLWSEDAAAVQAVIDSPPVRDVALWYSADGVPPLKWAQGRVRVFA